VFGALIGALFLGERLGPRRAIAAAVVLGGVVLISLP
jgi:drug/metabolite transporter (DMT)-like permease